MNRHKQERAEETQQRIMQSALLIFSKKGYQATSVAEICELAGVTKGAFFYHFPTKQSLFLALLENWLERLDRILETERTGKENIADALSAMADLLRLGLSQGEVYLPMFLEFWLQALRDREVWQKVIEPYRRYRAFFEEMFQQGIADKSLKPFDPQVTAIAAVSLALGLLLQGTMDPEGALWDEMAPATFRWMLDLMRLPQTD